MSPLYLVTRHEGEKGCHPYTWTQQQGEVSACRADLELCVVALPLHDSNVVTSVPDDTSGGGGGEGHPRTLKLAIGAGGKRGGGQILARETTSGWVKRVILLPDEAGLQGPWGVEAEAEVAPGPAGIEPADASQLNRVLHLVHL